MLSRLYHLTVTAHFIGVMLPLTVAAAVFAVAFIVLSVIFGIATAIGLYTLSTVIDVIAIFRQLKVEFSR
jgi:hypothetical protein